MNWFVFHIAGGDAFFSGIAFCLAGSIVSVNRTTWVKQIATLLFLLGLIAVAVSATPLSYWYYGVLASAALGWLFVVRAKSPSRRALWINTAAMTGTLAVGVALELSWRMAPSVTVTRDDVILVYGDSLSAGLAGGKITPWPELLARKTELKTFNLAKPGATVSRTREIVVSQPQPAGIVILEIGGNDILGKTTAAEFEEELDRLLVFLAKQHKQIIMFELPLPPFYNGFGRAQRRAATRHDIKLIPKRLLMEILAGDGATLDSIHLTQSGHERLAEAVGRMLERKNAE